MAIYNLLFAIKKIAIYICNGFLYLFFYLLEIKYTALTILFVSVLFLLLPRFIGRHEGALLRNLILLSGFFLGAVSFFSAPPVPFFSFLIVISTFLVLVFKLDQYHPAQTAFKFVYGSVGYGLIAIGVPLIEKMMKNTDLATSYSMQGQNYLSTIASILLFIFPLGYVAFLVKDLTLHKPQVAPEKMIELVRTRNQERKS